MLYQSVDKEYEGKFLLKLIEFLTYILSALKSPFNPS